MKLVFFAPHIEKPSVAKILSILRETLPTIEVKYFRDSQSLLEWLRIPPRDFFAAVLLPESNQTLLELAAMKDFFVDRKIMLLMPDNRPECRALGQVLNACCYQSVPWELNEVVSVLEKWLADGRAARQWFDSFASITVE